MSGTVCRNGIVDSLACHQSQLQQMQLFDYVDVILTGRLKFKKKNNAINVLGILLVCYLFDITLPVSLSVLPWGTFH